MTSNQQDLPFEQARNQRYLDLLEKKLAKNPLVGVTRNIAWIDDSDYRIRASAYHHPLIGRVGCDSDDEDVRDFYIGSRHIEDGDMRVYSWAAPIARLFFQPTEPGPEDVAVLRSYSHHLDEIVDLDDEWLREVRPSPFESRALKVPSPTAATARRRRVSSPEPASTVSAEAPSATEEPPDTGSHDVSVEPAPPSKTRDAGELRMGDAVLKRLQSPRQDRLSSVLSLLQPDQYRVVTWPVDEALVLQGHPGTGKTIVAAYRAAFLVNPQLYVNDGALAGRSKPLRVLLVGPTADYVHHVSDLIRPLAPDSLVRVTHLGELLEQTVDIKGTWPGSISGEHDDVDFQASRMAEKAARVLEARGGFKTGAGAARANVEAVYELVASNGSPGRPLTTDPDVVRWTSKLPAFNMTFKRRYLPLVARCRLAHRTVPDTDRFDHIIVDEAQDISPIEWSVLDQYLRRDGTWTLVGDMNQRRSDTTYGSWSDIADHLGLGDGENFAPEIMSRGYRSTGAILQFADRLLPARERGHLSIQGHGDEVHTEKVSREAELPGRAISLAALLAIKHAEGTVAIITVDPGALMTALGRAGWRRPASALNIWEREGTTLRFFVPEDARGLEFDAVVVVEPSLFPENLGRTGQLYTSLTRANRELAVVYHQPLPDALRRAGRR